MSFPRRQTLAQLVVVFLVASLAREAHARVDLLGTWHVLVHYTDAESEDPLAERWYDRVWKFEMKGRSLLWTEYSIVIFASEEGRFETIGVSTPSRVLGYWEPNERQAKNIRTGLEIVDRNSRSKTLRGSFERGFRSGGSLRSTSASVIEYRELWSIEDPTGKPVFGRDDVLGSARTEAMEGRTRYETREVDSGGNVLSGHFERDAVMRGSFRMTRAGESRLHVGEEVDRKADPEDVLLGFAVDRGPLADELESLLDLPDRAQQRERVRELVRALLEEDLLQRGQDPRVQTPRVLRLTDKIEVVLIEDGASLDELEGMLRRGELRP